MIHPQPTPRSREFWEAAAHHRLVLPRCTHCAVWLHPQDEICPDGHTELVWAESSGRGTVVAAATVHRTVHPARPAPYVVLVVRLDEGPHLISNLYGRAELDDPVHAVFDHLVDDPGPTDVVVGFTADTT